MPVMQLNIVEGRSDDIKRRLVRELTDTLADILESKPEQVRIIINEMPKMHFAIGGTTAADLGR